MDQVDDTRIKASQGQTAALLSIALVLGAWPLAAAMGAVNLLGAWVPRWSLPGLVYDRVLVRWLRPRVRLDRKAPHRFAQGFSGVVTALGAGLVGLGLPVLGWALVGLVVGLAGMSITTGFCAGCFTYRQLAWLGVPGFVGEDRCTACEL